MLLFKDMERFGELAKRRPETDKEKAAAQDESERLERVAREDVESTAAYLHEVVGKMGSYSESIPLDESGRINSKSFAQSNNTGRNILERAPSVALTWTGFNAFIDNVKKLCPDYKFSTVKQGDLLILKVESRND